VVNSVVEAPVTKDDTSSSLSAARRGSSRRVASSTERGGGDDDDASSADRSRYANQPGGAREGLSAAYGSLTKGVRRAANTIVAIPMKEYRRVGAQVGPPGRHARRLCRGMPL
jgi:hypothetical protein